MFEGYGKRRGIWRMTLSLIRPTRAGGLRKIRMATGGQGKSGSVRVIYFLALPDFPWQPLDVVFLEMDNDIG